MLTNSFNSQFDIIGQICVKHFIRTSFLITPPVLPNIGEELWLQLKFMRAELSMVVKAAEADSIYVSAENHLDPTKQRIYAV